MLRLLQIFGLIFFILSEVPSRAAAMPPLNEGNPFDYHLPNPPLEGALLERDFALLHHFQEVRTSTECMLAGQESNLNLDNAFGPAVGVLTQAEIESVRILSAAVMVRSWPIVFYYKSKYKRPRPYVVDKTLQPCIRTPSTPDASYPSGHSTVGYTLARVLAKKFPAKSEAILKQGLQIGENRVIGGVHFPSDVEAGRILAEQIFTHLSDLY